MTFHSILFKRAEDGINNKTVTTPDFFVDLNLDQVIDAVTAGKEEYDLRPFFYYTLSDIDAIRYRQDIMQDLENNTLFNHITSFAEKMQASHKHFSLANKLYYKYQKERWFLDAVDLYCDAVNCLAHNLSAAPLKSRGFLAFRQYLTNYAKSDRFQSLLAETERVKADLASVKYCLHITGKCIRVRRYDSEADYSAEVEETFAKFRQGAVKDYLVKFSLSHHMNHVEAALLDLVAKLYLDTFLHLDHYCARNANYLEETIDIFEREIQFYVAYLDFISTFKQKGLTFCYPQIHDQSKEVGNYEGFDIALAHKVMAENSSLVCNDFYLKDPERIIVVSGPNQGGKTTFARTFGQLHYLASLGCPVPGREAQLFLFDQLLTHFEKEEDITNFRGKLEDDLVRLYSILEKATSNSIIIMNEIFTSTTLEDATFLSKEIMEKIIQRDLLCVWVTFIDELASLSEKTVSMVSTIVPENPALRTYKIIRKPADGLAYALSIAEKYRLTYECLKDRINHEDLSNA